MHRLTLKDFSYEIPDELIAQEPLEDRAASRLLVHGPDGRIEMTFQGTFNP